MSKAEIARMTAAAPVIRNAIISSIRPGIACTIGDRAARPTAAVMSPISSSSHSPMSRTLPVGFTLRVPGLRR
jgi:hypothetical protein